MYSIKIVYLGADPEIDAIADFLRHKKCNVDLVTPFESYNPIGSTRTDILIIPDGSGYYPMTAGCYPFAYPPPSNHQMPKASFECFRVNSLKSYVDGDIKLIGIGSGAVMLYDAVLGGKLRFDEDGRLLPMVDTKLADFEGTEPMIFKTAHLAGLEHFNPKPLWNLIEFLCSPPPSPVAPTVPILVPK